MDTLHIVGGGGQNLLLNQFTANAVGRPVVVGPVEATAAGNILMQMVASGEIASLAEGREIIRRSFELTMYVPVKTPTSGTKPSIGSKGYRVSSIDLGFPLPGYRPHNGVRGRLFAGMTIVQVVLGSLSALCGDPDPFGALL